MTSSDRLLGDSDMFVTRGSPERIFVESCAFSQDHLADVRSRFDVFCAICDVTRHEFAAPPLLRYSESQMTELAGHVTSGGVLREIECFRECFLSSPLTKTTRRRVVNNFAP